MSYVVPTQHEWVSKALAENSRGHLRFSDPVSKGKKIADAPKGEFVPHPTNAGLNSNRYDVEYERGKGSRIYGRAIGGGLLAGAPGVALATAGGMKTFKHPRSKWGNAAFFGGHIASGIGAGVGVHRGINRSIRRGDVRITDRKTKQRATRTTLMMNRPTGWE